MARTDKKATAQHVPTYMTARWMEMRALAGGGVAQASMFRRRKQEQADLHNDTGTFEGQSEEFAEANT